MNQVVRKIPIRFRLLDTCSGFFLQGAVEEFDTLFSTIM